MDRAAARAKLKELGDAKKKVEEECDMLVELLSQPGFPGLKGGLVDAEGFPRADIDIPDVRTKRSSPCNTTALCRNLALLHAMARDAGYASA